MSPKKKPASRSKPSKRPASKKKPGAAPGARKGAPKGKARRSVRGGKKGAGPLKKKSTRPARAQAAPSAPPAENPRAKAMAQRIAQLVLDKKATEVLILDVRGKASYADYMVIASGESDRQVSAMAENVLTQMKGEGHRPVGSEGQETGNWVLIDFGEVVAHLFFTEVRGFYDLEGLWADAPREKVA